MSLPLEGSGITGIYDISVICQLTVLLLFKKNFFMYGCTGSLLLCAGVLWLQRTGLLSGCAARASHCGAFSVVEQGQAGFSSCGAQA